MTTTVPPAQSSVAAPQCWGAATVQDLWRESDATGVPACTLYRSAQEFVRLNAEHVGHED